MLRFSCAAYSGLTVRHAPVFAVPYSLFCTFVLITFWFVADNNLIFIRNFDVIMIGGLISRNNKNNSLSSEVA